MNEQYAVAVVVDVVASRQHLHQSALLEGLAARIEQVLVRDGRAMSAGATVGDEAQALYGAAGVAVLDVARLRLSLLVEPPADTPVDLRVGFGLGAVASGPDGPPHAAQPGQSGTAWWHARTAIERAGRRRNGWPAQRWWAAGDGDLTALQAALLALDTLLLRFDDDDRRAAAALLSGASAAEVATLLEVTPQTVSARLHGHGVYGLVRTLQHLAAPTEQA